MTANNFNEWMASIGNIYYADNNLMSQAFEKLNNNIEAITIKIIKEPTTFVLSITTSNVSL